MHTQILDALDQAIHHAMIARRFAPDRAATLDAALDVLNREWNIEKTRVDIEMQIEIALSAA